MAQEPQVQTASTQVNELQLQIQELQQQLAESQIKNQAMWNLLVRLGNRLQLSSTSIKMAVSSLLDYDIFWDKSTVHEFLQVIDKSSDQASNLIMLLTLAFRSQAKRLEINPEPHMLQEILTIMPSEFSKGDSEVALTINYPIDGKPVLVDFQYLLLALRLLIEVVIGQNKKSNQITIEAKEFVENWFIEIEIVEAPIITIIEEFFERPNEFLLQNNQFLPEDMLKLLTAWRILHLQNIQICIQQEPNKNSTLCLNIPTVLDK